MMTMNGLELVIFGIAGFVMSILSGIAGAGGGFIMTPLAIFLGLLPAQAVATGKLNGLSVTKARVMPVMILALLVGLFVPFIIKSLDDEVYRIVLGIIILLMIPVVIVKKVGIKPHKPKVWQKYTGGGLLTIALFLQGVFSGGLGTLVNLVLMDMLGMTAIEANVTKRWSQVILNTTIIIGVLGTGLIVWKVAAVGVFSNLIGSYIGGSMAVNKGNDFIMRVMVVLMFISAVALIIGA